MPEREAFNSALVPYLKNQTTRRAASHHNQRTKMKAKQGCRMLCRRVKMQGRTRHGWDPSLNSNTKTNDPAAKRLDPSLARVREAYLLPWLAGWHQFVTAVNLRSYCMHYAVHKGNLRPAL